MRVVQPRPMQTHREVLVVGAGAAGLMAAIHAARRGRRTRLLEKNSRAGLKILISGGGRCNLTTTKVGTDLEAQYGSRRGRFLRHALRAFPPPALCAFFTAAGVALQEEDLDKIFPVSQRARDVLDALLRLAADSGVEIVHGAPVQQVQRQANGFLVTTPRGPIGADRLVLATGGLSYPKTGATGDGYGFARSLGHTVTPTWPALAPLLVTAPWLRALQGIVLTDAALAVLDGDGRERQRRRRPILFTHQGLSGPGPMDLAGDIEELSGSAVVRFDLAPDTSADELERGLLAAAAANGAQKVVHALPPALPERLRTTLVALAQADTTLANLSRPSRRQLVATIKDLRVPVARSLGFAHAEVTRGGVALDEIDPRTMQSRCCPGLYVVGELLDVDGPIGGFNFQAAFATGRLAGLDA